MQIKSDFRADLHCHTACSDGTTQPEEIIQLAINKGLQGLSITDHDTIQAYVQAAPLAQNKGLPLISGVEFSALHQQSSVHILAYSFSLTSSLIQEFCQQHHQRRLQRIQMMLEKLTAYGIPLSLDDLSSHISPHSFGRPHIALALVKKGYVQTIQQAFQQYIGEGKPCYVQGQGFSVEETIDLIHQAHGLAVIAHPHLIDQPKTLRDLLAMNFDGIEGYYSRFPQTEHDRWIKIGAHRGWIITGGSDFHGSIKPNVSLGCSWVNEETFHTLYQHFQSNQTP